VDTRHPGPLYINLFTHFGPFQLADPIGARVGNVVQRTRLASNTRRFSCTSSGNHLQRVAVISWRLQARADPYYRRATSLGELVRQQSMLDTQITSIL
jgi:hypothetical protein